MCWICGRPGADTADHVVPAALGGGDELENLRPAHRSCNASRGIGKRDLRRPFRTSRAW
ncbi:HNH endonuclease [Actinomyces succiniciruminis]|uniref:HNH endonuclease n=1 Tax=Actinomyces succiniciruminis TaxID=1522002 RepID=UPI002453F94B|nr:HNH endonuclease [Actinomyces succiniciruminis]